eukprot:Opistho-2@80700
MQQPVIVLNQTVKRESGRKVQLSNIASARAVADVIRTCLGPRAMLKMLMDPMGGIVMTNDGNAILREIDVSHPAAKSMIEISRTQDEEVGDGTTSVIILAGEMLTVAEPFLEPRCTPPSLSVRTPRLWMMQPPSLKSTSALPSTRMTTRLCSTLSSRVSVPSS